MDNDEAYDVVVVGGGTAGLSAALGPGRSRGSVLFRQWSEDDAVTPYGGLITSAADGMTAGTLVNHELILEDTAAAVAQHRKDVT